MYPKCQQRCRVLLTCRHSVLRPSGIQTRKGCPYCAQCEHWPHLHRAAPWRRSDKLFICVGTSKRGHPATKQTLSRWVVETIVSAYEASELPVPKGLRAHSTKGIADICKAAYVTTIDKHTVLRLKQFSFLSLFNTPKSKWTIAVNSWSNLLWQLSIAPHQTCTTIPFYKTASAWTHLKDVWYEQLSCDHSTSLWPLTRPIQKEKKLYFSKSSL